MVFLRCSCGFCFYQLSVELHDKVIGHYLNIKHYQ
ncbi:IS1 family transposase [Escherichia coli]